MKNEDSNGNALVTVFTVIFFVIMFICISNGCNTIETMLISFWITIVLMFIVSITMKISKKNKQKQNEKENNKDSMEAYAKPLQTSKPVQADISTEIGIIPTYSDAIDDEMFIPTPKMKQIASQEPFGWEHLLFGQSLKDNSTFLQKFRSQTPDNPFVKAIGNDSEGDDYADYLKRMLAQILLETHRFESKFSIYLSHLEEAMGAPGEDGDADELMAVAIEFMEPYITYLAFYNDLCTIQSPSKAEEIHTAMKYLLEGLLNCFEDFYNSTYENVLYAVAHPENAGEVSLGNIKLSIDEKKAAYIKTTLEKNPDTLSGVTIHRKTI